ncbi:prepilin-type N-terminal cleavage/methylation domain-containing protein [Patescibacteria group bacterium]|nr:prepilin-type N-terminal cleavage/methylation domain-containing protein [Patescibacteria group bacterium]
MNNKSFTLLEAIIAIFIITVGVVGVLGLVSQTIGSVIVSSQKLIAAYLAQEGIEIVRNIRDTNWLEGAPSWDEGLGEDDWEGDYTMTQNLNFCLFACGYDDLSFLKIDANGFYSYSAGNDTKFKRKITIADKEDLSDPPDGVYDKMTVTVEVFWREKGKTYNVSAQENLYNWR